MTLSSNINYKSKIKTVEEINPDSVLGMLREVRSEISDLDSSFKNKTLKEVLWVIEEGTYRIDGTVRKVINLSHAKEVISKYRENSEGGCLSCVSLGKETIDAQDGSSGWYCKVSDPDYNRNTRGEEPGVRYGGSSPKIKEHYKNPCGDWKPKFPKKLEILLAKL